MISSRSRSLVTILLVLACALGSTRGLWAQTFTDASGGLGSGEQARPLGASAVDLNQDGLVDIYQRGRLYMNQGDGTFINDLSASGLQEGTAPFGGIFGDYTGDGLPDAFLMDLNGDSRLYQATEQGPFVWANTEAGVVTQDVAVQGSLWFDYDADGKLDLFIGGDGQQDLLFRNVDGTAFEDKSMLVQVATPRNDYGAAAADFDRDGDIDLYIGACHGTDPTLSRNVLWLNEGGNSFLQVAAGAEDDRSSWGVTWFDYDNDGWLDLFVANGLATNDGWIDLFVGTNFGGRLFVNDGGANHWLTVGTRGIVSNRLGIGARVELYATGAEQVREITAGDGMTSQNHSFRAHFGLGLAAEIDSVVVRWPSGIVDRVPQPPVDTYIVVTEGQGGSTDVEDSERPSSLLGVVGLYPNPFTERTTIAVATGSASHVAVDVHDLTGRRIRTVADGFVPAGSHEWTWTGRDDGDNALPAGRYFVRVRAGNDSRTSVATRLP